MTPSNISFFIQEKQDYFNYILFIEVSSSLYNDPSFIFCQAAKKIALIVGGGGGGER